MHVFCKEICLRIALVGEKYHPSRRAMGVSVDRITQSVTAMRPHQIDFVSEMLDVASRHSRIALFA
jgi:hypothetical protein